MVVIVYDNVIMPFVEELEKRYKKSSIGELGRGDKVGDVLASFKKPPLFNDGWLILCEWPVRVDVIRRLEAAAPLNKIVIRVHSYDELNEVSLECAEVAPKVVDNHKVTRNEMARWVQDELHCSALVADAVVKRTHCYVSDVMQAVQILSVFDSVTEYDVYRYVKVARYVSVNDLVSWALGVPRRGVSFRDVAYLVDDFRYALPWLLSEIVKILDGYVIAYQYALAGELSLSNYREFRNGPGNAALGGMSERQLYKIMRCFGIVSLEYVVYLREQVNLLPKKEKLSLYRLVQLIRLGGER